MHLIIANIRQESMVWCHILFQEQKHALVGVMIYKRMPVSPSGCIFRLFYRWQSTYIRVSIILDVNT